jgi:tetratricopeptide (TPR) repeat protein
LDDRNRTSFGESVMARGTILGPIFLALVCTALPLKSYGQSREDILRGGIRAFEVGDFARAKQMLSELVRQDPSAEHLGYLAMAEAASGELAQAITHFQKSIQLGNNSAPVRYNLGLALLKTRQFEAGLRELRGVMAIDPKFAAAPYALGVTLLDAGRAKEGLPYLEQARRLSPGQAEIWANVVRAHFEVDEATMALRTVDEAIEAFPENPRLSITIAHICLRHRQIQKARDLLENAAKLWQDDPAVKLLLAKVRLLTGEPDESLAMLKDMGLEVGEPGEVMLLRGEAKALAGDMEAAAAELSSAIRADPRNVKYLVASAWLDQMSGRFKEALVTLKKARSLDERAPEIPYRMAVSYLFLGLNSDAAQTCQEAVRRAPKFGLAYLLLGVVKLRQGDLPGAQAVLRRAVALQPSSGIFHRELGMVLYKGGNLIESKKELDRALALDPKAAQAYFWRARVLASRGERRQAIADLETAVALQPHYREAYSQLAQLYSKQRQPEKAKAASAQAIKELQYEQKQASEKMWQMKDLIGEAEYPELEALRLP